MSLELTQIAQAEAEAALKIKAAEVAAIESVAHTDAVWSDKITNLRQDMQPEFEKIVSTTKQEILEAKAMAEKAFAADSQKISKVKTGAGQTAAVDFVLNHITTTYGAG